MSMDATRRDFLKQALALAAAGTGAHFLPAAIQRALAIDPPPGTTFLDAEHIVILMQENRSFDHCYGTLQGVRGFNDPRAVTLPNGNPVWLQTNAAGQTYAPFRLNIKDTKSTWMSCLPHSWSDQTDAWNGGRCDRWLDAKASGVRAYAHMPLTLGYYTREDIPFYYALADAFTVCDQNFCSSRTGTTPNRLHLWTGTIRAEPTPESKACVRNSDVDYSSEVSWTTFPERLEDLGISWRIYQNELSVDTGLYGEANSWLGNFTDNTLEHFKQYHVRFLPSHRRWLKEQEKSLLAELAELEKEPLPPESEAAQKRDKLRARLERNRAEQERWSEERFAALSPRERALHEKAFTTNIGDPHYRELETLVYQDGETTREMKVPKGDVLHQFRVDVKEGKLPTVSWLVAPEFFSDHPCAPWYGAWYLAEVLDILTANPEVWKKTIFILCYDENDGYFDHVVPYSPPHPDRPESGAASAGLDTRLEHVTEEQEAAYQKAHPNAEVRVAPIGLGYRVPLVIASPWTRGGFVNSEVFDHTSILQFLEVFLSHKTGKKVEEPQISAWRRAICGDLTSVFRPWQGEPVPKPEPPERKAFLSGIHQAQFRGLPTGYREWSEEEQARVRKKPLFAEGLPRQEPGTRPACPLPYDLYVDGLLSEDRQRFEIRFQSSVERFGPRTAGAPFHVYAPGKAWLPGTNPPVFAPGRTWAYAVAAGSVVSGQWLLDEFGGDTYHLRVQGPNGFYREFRGTARDPRMEVKLQPVPKAEDGRPGLVLVLRLLEEKRAPLKVWVEDVSYGQPPREVVLSTDEPVVVSLALAASHHWYDLRVYVGEAAPRFFQRFAGHHETGDISVTDPLMGGVA